MFRSQRRHTLATLAALSLLALGASDALSQDLPPQNLPILGGTGGTAFSLDCGSGHVLSGLRYRNGLVIDAIGLLCRPVLANGSLGPESTVGSIVGGSGGTTNVVSCPSGMVLVALRVRYGSYVSYMIITCRTWNSTTRTYASTGGSVNSLGSVLTPSSATVDEACESSHQPGAGIRGRSASFVDAIGLVCDEP
jgi:hypothetical protein